MFNSCIFVGNLGNDPEVRAIKNGANAGSSFTTFSIAVNKSGEKEAQPLWVSVSAFGKTGEFVGKYLKKGSQVLIQGSVELQDFEGKDGKTRTSLKMVANRVESLGKREAQADGAAAGTTSGATTSAPANKSVTDEDIPF